MMKLLLSLLIVVLQFPNLGILKQKSVSNTSNNLMIGCECLDRDYADYHSYKPYLDSLGMHFARFQAGWAKTEKSKGKYDFTWLDAIVDDCVSRGIEPLLEISYGNPIYEGGGTPYLAGGWPTSAEAKKAWDKWVGTMVRRYRGKVHYWEIWNEPELAIAPETNPGTEQYEPEIPGKFESMVQLQVSTARIIKRIDRKASIAALALARLDPVFIERFMTAVGKDKDLFDWITYHGYRYRPEEMYPAVEKMQKALRKYSDRIILWQGETGAPSVGGMGGALSNYDWTEISQGKWLLRRIVSDRARNIRSGLFTISDMAFGSSDYVKKRNFKGLLRTDENRQVTGKKLSFDAVRNLVSVYELLDRTLPAGSISGKVWESTGSRYLFEDIQTGTKSIVFWEDSKIPGNSTISESTTLKLKDFSFKNPVCLDIRTGMVYTLNSKTSGSGQTLTGVPCYDSPVLITELNNLEITPAGCSLKDTHLPKAEGYRTKDPAITSLLQAIRDAGSTNELNSVILLKDGKKVLEYYDVCYGPDFLNICWSASKTFTATAVGFAIQEGRMKLDGKIVDYLKPEQLPAQVSDTLASLTVYDLLRMASGLKEDGIGQFGSYNPARTIKGNLEAGFIFAPGEKYKYNSFNTYLLSVAITNVTGQKVVDFLKPRLFEPLGIRNYHWDESIEGYSMGGWGLYITSESLAKMGQFFLQKGKWNGKQLLNSGWIENATKAQIMQYTGKGLSEKEISDLPDDGTNSGYCFQMWRGRNNSVRLDGAHGQYSIILPDDNAVIVITGNCNKVVKERDAIWEFLYPIVKSEK